jgi:hypothetical protein
MLKTHMDAREALFLAQWQLQAHAGHSLHKGNPREFFVRKFLREHLPPTMAIGTGELIDAGSKPKERRNQHDIVLFRDTYPKLSFGGGVSAFLIESVVATIEVKSVLTKDALEKAIKAARSSKNLIPSTTQSFEAGYVPPAILNYLVAYDSRVSVATVHKWIRDLHQKMGIADEPLPSNTEERQKVVAPSVDAIFIMGKGSLYFDNVPFGFASPSMREDHPQSRWICAEANSGSLLLLFLFLLAATLGVAGRWLNPFPYIASLQMDVQFANEALT